MSDSSYWIMMYPFVDVKFIRKEAWVVENEKVCEGGESEGVEIQLRMKLQGKAYSILGLTISGYWRRTGCEERAAYTTNTYVYE